MQGSIQKHVMCRTGHYSPLAISGRWLLVPKPLACSGLPEYSSIPCIYISDMSPSHDGPFDSGSNNCLMKTNSMANNKSGLITFY